MSEYVTDAMREAARALGRIGGNAVKAKYGSEHYETIGAKGGAATKALHGSGHYQRIGKLGGAKSKRGKASS